MKGYEKVGGTEVNENFVDCEEHLVLFQFSVDLLDLE